MTIQVYRTNASSYQNSQFFAREQKAIEDLNGITYIRSLKEVNDTKPFILITNTHTRPEEISKVILNKTILMIHPNSGHDNISKDFLEQNNFPIILGNPIRSHAVSEYILSCIFQRFSSIPNHHHWSQDRLWSRKLLRNQRVVIVGFGHIGKLINNALSQICREITILDPYVKNSFENKNLHQTWDDSIFNDVDILIMASSLTETSHHMINSNILKKLAEDVLIINPARGELINEGELVSFLQKNPNAYAYLDVFTKEPFSPGYLHNLPNVNKTSHIAGVFGKLNNDIISFEYLVIRDFVEQFKKQDIDTFFAEYEECLLTTKSFI